MKRINETQRFFLIFVQVCVDKLAFFGQIKEMPPISVHFLLYFLLAVNRTICKLLAISAGHLIIFSYLCSRKDKIMAISTLYSAKRIEQQFHTGEEPVMVGITI